MKYLSWAIAVAVLSVTLGWSACHFGRPEILLGLILAGYLPNPFDESRCGEAQ